MQPDPPQGINGKNGTDYDFARPSSRELAGWKENVVRPRLLKSTKASKRIVIISAVVAALHFLLTMGTVIAPVLLSTGGERGLLLDLSLHASEVLLQPLGWFFEPAGDFPLSLGLVMVFANSAVWGAVLGLMLAIRRRTGQSAAQISGSN